MKYKDFDQAIRSPFDNQGYFFINKCLPFGASINCAHFQEFSDAVAFIMQNKTKKQPINYLDDFLFITLLARLCDYQMETFLKVCDSINFPVAEEKTFWSTTRLVFGVQLDWHSWASSCCPFKLLHTYTMLRGGYKCENEQFFIYRDRNPVKPDAVRNVLRTAITRIGLNPTCYNCHSWRIGHCSELIQLGYSIKAVKRFGRWKSNAVYKYIKT